MPSLKSLLGLASLAATFVLTSAATNTRRAPTSISLPSTLPSAIWEDDAVTVHGERIVLANLNPVMLHFLEFSLSGPAKTVDIAGSSSSMDQEMSEAVAHVADHATQTLESLASQMSHFESVLRELVAGATNVGPLDIKTTSTVTREASTQSASTITVPGIEDPSNQLEKLKSLLKEQAAEGIAPIDRSKSGSSATDPAPTLTHEVDSDANFEAAVEALKHAAEAMTAHLDKSASLMEDVVAKLYASLMDMDISDPNEGESRTSVKSSSVVSGLDADVQAEEEDDFKWPECAPRRRPSLDDLPGPKYWRAYLLTRTRLLHTAYDDLATHFNMNISRSSSLSEVSQPRKSYLHSFLFDFRSSTVQLVEEYWRDLKKYELLLMGEGEGVADDMLFDIDMKVSTLDCMLNDMLVRAYRRRLRAFEGMETTGVEMTKHGIELAVNGEEWQEWMAV